MLLAIDVGNTNTVLGMFAGDDLVSSWRIKTDSRTTADEMVLTFRGLLEGSGAVTGIALCSTVPAVLREMRVMLERYFDAIPTVIVEPGTKTGVPVLTDNPKEVGADRIVNTIAAHHLFGGPCIVVDFGTSTNFDVVNADGDYIGGAIAPGVEVSMEALTTRAARLIRVDMSEPEHAIGKDTTEAMQAGAVYGFAGQVDGIVRAIWAELGVEAKVVATGGLAEFIARHTATISAVDQLLTLRGIEMVLRRQQAH